MVIMKEYLGNYNYEICFKYQYYTSFKNMLIIILKRYIKYINKNTKYMIDKFSCALTLLATIL